ncbi:MAG: hypothetical protein KF893_09110 [Caldilineaceae bacterium]|nr:hypothetical protein [Caldilineaceae bacterium]
MNHRQGDYTLIGADLDGLWLQPGFVEGIVADGKRFASLEAAYRHLFRHNREYAILLWNGLPLRLSYQEDLPGMVNHIIALLYFVQDCSTPARRSFRFQTVNIKSLWQLEVDSTTVSIEGFWKQVPGRYETALNQLGTIRMARLAFLCEWKLLVEQLIQALVHGEVILTRPEAQKRLQILHALKEKIPSRGRFYHY